MAYTFDAGPNAFLFMEEPELEVFASVLHANFGGLTPSDKFYKGIPIQLADLKSDLPQAKENFASIGPKLTADEAAKGELLYVINCRVGRGPQVAP